MFTAVFAILLLASSWYSWRRNPMYSRRRTLHWMLAIGLSFAAAVSLFAAVLQFTQGLSETVQLTAMFTAVFAATVALIAIIINVTNPATAPIPAGMRPSTLHRRKLLVWIKAAIETLLVLAVGALLPYALPGKTSNVLQFIALFLGAWVLGLGGILLAAGYFAARVADKSLTAVQANAWIHWTYSTEEWSAFIEREVIARPAPAKRYTRKEMVGVLSIAVPVAAGGFLAGLGWAGLSWLAAGGLALGAVLIVWLHRTAQAAPARFRSRLGHAPRETWIGPDGLFANGAFHPWVSPGVFLIEARGPSNGSGNQADSLHFCFEKINAGAAATLIEEPVLIPVSADRSQLVALLATLQRELNFVVKTANVQLLRPGQL